MNSVLYLFLASVSTLLCIAVISEAGVVNAPGNGYTRWPSNIILYRIAGLAGNDLIRIQDAMNQINIDSGGCISFSQYNAAINAGQPFLAIQPRFSNPSTPNDICWTYPGYTSLAGANGQIMTMFSSTSGNAVGNCLDDKRDTMRQLMNALGIRNEFSRADRNVYMQFSNAGERNALTSPTLQKYNMFAESNKYTTAQTIITSTQTFDFDSITMINGAKYAANPGVPIFTTTGTVGNQQRLSVNDCLALKQLYSCPATGSGATPTCQNLPMSTSSGIVVNNGGNTANAVVSGVPVLP